MGAPGNLPARAGKAPGALANEAAARSAALLGPGDMLGVEHVDTALVLLAAFGLLLAVAARRLALPDGVMAFGGRLASSFKPRRREPAAAAPIAQEVTLEALLGARERGMRTREMEAKTGGAGAAAPQAVARQPAAGSRPAPQATAGPGAGAPRPAARPRAEADPPASQGSGRKLTAAEILLARRKGKGP